MGPLQVIVPVPHWRRAIRAAITLCTVLSLAACATHETYGDRALPQDQRAVVEGYARYQVLYFEDLRIFSVDGGQGGWPYAASVSVPAGRHWLQFVILRNESNVALCAFEAMFEAGHRYKLRRLVHGQTLLAHPLTPRFQASISMTVTDPAGRSREEAARAECSQDKHCRQAADCPARSECRTEDGFVFGTCQAPAR